MILVLAHLTCDGCGFEGWSVQPFAIMGEAVQCACCNDYAATPTPGTPMHRLPDNSPRVYDWYCHHPEEWPEALPCR